MSNLNNVALWFARDKYGNVITIDKVNKDYENTYICPLCGSEVLPRAIKSKKITPHYYHIDKSKCAGESIIHWWVKNEIIKKGDTIKTNNGKEYIVKSILLETNITTRFGVYNPDIEITCDDNSVIYLEINHTNKKEFVKYIDMWNEIGNTVLELSTKDIVSNIYKSENVNYKIIYEKGMSKNKIKPKLNSYEKKKTAMDEKYSNNSFAKDLKWLWNTIEKYNQDDDFYETFTSIEGLLNTEYRLDIIKIISDSNCKTVKNKFVEYKHQVISSKISDIANVDIKCFEKNTSNISFEIYNYPMSRSIWDSCELIINEINKALIKNEISFRINEKSYNIYKILNDRFSKIGIECSFSKGDGYSYHNKIVINDYDIYIFCKSDSIDICSTYTYTKRMYVYNPKKHRQTLRYVKFTGYSNISNFKYNNNSVLFTFISDYIRKIKYGCEAK